eukprot:6204924-Pleurochrysis_carterae.AAC.4
MGVYGIATNAGKGTTLTNVPKVPVWDTTTMYRLEYADTRNSVTTPLISVVRAALRIGKFDCIILKRQVRLGTAIPKDTKTRSRRIRPAVGLKLASRPSPSPRCNRLWSPLTPRRRVRSARAVATHCTLRNARTRACHAAPLS